VKTAGGPVIPPDGTAGRELNAGKIVQVWGGATVRLIGVEPRAKEAKAALVRLRREIEHAIEQGQLPDADLTEVAEAVGVLSNIMVLMGDALAEEGGVAGRFAAQMQYFIDYHRVQR
jgi:hypothetical protein